MDARETAAVLLGAVPSLEVSVLFQMVNKRPDVLDSATACVTNLIIIIIIFIITEVRIALFGRLRGMSRVGSHH